jgi:hypothetical protein
MVHDNDDDAFDALFAEISSDGVAAKVAEVSDEPAVGPSLAESREAVIQEVISGPVAKPDQKVQYKTVDKVAVDGGPCQSMVYPLGYVSLLFGGWRFSNKACFYLDGLKDLIAFCRSPQCDAWLASLEAAGLRNRGQAKKEA